VARAAKDSLLFTTFRGCANMTGRPTRVKESMQRILSRGRPPYGLKRIPRPRRGPACSISELRHKG